MFYFKPKKERIVFSIIGSDRINFLQKIITNDLNSETKELYALILSPQGRYLYDIFILNRENDILIECLKEYEIKIVKLLASYRINADVIFKKTNYKVLLSFIPNKSLLHFKDPRHNSLGYRIYAEDENTLEIKENLYIHYEYLRIDSLILDAERDMFENKGYPFHYGLDYSISYKKGCYIGQEVVMRSRISGNRSKQVYKIILEGDEENFHNSGDDIKNNNGIKIGVMGSRVRERGLALLDTKKLNELNCITLENHVIVKIISQQLI